MIGTGAITRAGRGLYRYMRLPKLIEKQKSIHEQHILYGYTGAKRFRLATSLFDAVLEKQLGELRLAEERLTLKRRYIRRLRKELDLAANDLRQKPATQLETAALGVAIRDLSVFMDDRVDAFEQRGERSIQETTKQLALQLEANERAYAAKRQALERDLREQARSATSYTDKRVTEILARLEAESEQDRLTILAINNKLKLLTAVISGLTGGILGIFVTLLLGVW